MVDEETLKRRLDVLLDKVDHARIAATLATELGDLEEFARVAAGWR